MKAEDMLKVELFLMKGMLEKEQVEVIVDVGAVLEKEEAVTEDDGLIISEILNVLFSHGKKPVLSFYKIFEVNMLFLLHAFEGFKKENEISFRGCDEELFGEISNVLNIKIGLELIKNKKEGKE